MTRDIRPLNADEWDLIAALRAKTPSIVETQLRRLGYVAPATIPPSRMELSASTVDGRSREMRVVTIGDPEDGPIVSKYVRFYDSDADRWGEWEFAL